MHGPEAASFSRIFEELDPSGRRAGNRNLTLLPKTLAHHQGKRSQNLIGLFKSIWVYESLVRLHLCSCSRLLSGIWF